MLERRLIKNIDYKLIIIVLLILVFGLIIISSATHVTMKKGDNKYYYVYRQIIWILIGLGSMIAVLRSNYVEFGKFAKILYIINIMALLAVDIVGSTTLGSQRSFSVGGFNIQPSEISKIIIIITFANFLTKREGKLEKFKDLIPCFIFVGFPFLLVLKQPDMGTALVLMAIMFGMLFVAGAKPRVLISIILLGAISVSGILFYDIKYDKRLIFQPYQQKRLTIFIDPTQDPLGAGYQMIQSQIAIGSGGIKGKGLYNGSQSNLDYLPKDEQHTDFIFAVVGEELGFVGEMILLLLFFYLLVRGIDIAGKARDFFGTLLAAGVVAMWAFHLMVNIGMTAGIMPVTGIPLPFISYGGSSMLTNMLAVGLLINIYMRRQKIMF